MLDDLILLRRYAKDRDEDAFTALVRRHLDGVYSAAMRQVDGNAPLAEDVAQEVFVLLARNADRVSRHPILAAWLYTTARNVARYRMRGERRRRARELEACAMDEAPSNSALELDWTHLGPMLDEAIDELGERDRNAVLLRFIDRRPFGEIGAVLNVSESGARMRVERALDKLRSSFARRGVVSSSSALVAALANKAVIAAPAGLATAVTSAALAAGAGASALGFLQFLAATKSSLGGAAILALAAALGVSAIGAAIYELQSARQAKISLAVAHQGYETQLGRLRELDRKVESADQTQIGLLNAIDGLRSTGASPPRPGGHRLAAKAEGRIFLANFPEVRALLREIGKAQLAKSYGSFYRSAALTPAQVDRFTTLMVENWIDNLAVAPPTSINPAVDQLPANELRAVLGDEDYRSFQDYSRVKYAHGMANDIAAAVNYTAAPLSMGQTDQLARIISDNGSACPANCSLDADSIDWSSVLAQARSVLSASQWKSAEGVLLYQEFGNAFVQALQTQVAAAPLPPPAQ